MSEGKKTKRKIVPNIGMIVFFVIIIYLLGYIMTYLERDKLAIYEVSESDVKDTIEGTGIIIRDEELVTTDSAGYISPYVKEGSRVKVGGTVYTLDTTGKIQEFIQSVASEKDDTDDEEKTTVINDLQSFMESYDDDRFSDVYTVKSDVSYDLQAYTDTIMAQNTDAFNEKYGDGSYTEQTSDQAGIVSFQSDGMENKTIEKLTAEDFEGKNSMENLRTTGKVEAKTPVYRIVTSQTWHIIVQLSQDEYLKMKALEKNDTTTVNVAFNKEDFTAKADFTCFVQNSDYYIDLSFDQYVQKYLNQRYLWVRMILSDEDGLIVPASSITYKEAYRISQDFICESEDGESGDYVNVLSENGESVNQVEVDIIKTKNDYVYVNSAELTNGDTITNSSQKETFVLEKKSKVRGVFVVNQGYAAFTPVEVTEKTEDYCILSEYDSEVQIYDRIILHSDSIQENQVIY